MDSWCTFILTWCTEKGDWEFGLMHVDEWKQKLNEVGYAEIEIKLDVMNDIKLNAI